MTVREALAYGSARTSALEARLLLQHLLRVDRTFLLREPGHEINDLAYDALLARRPAEPLAYIIGKKEFYGLDFRVTPDTLIPRPETETLVEAVLARPAGRTLDVGTGSGAIAVCLQPTRPVVAIDLSPAAAEIARENGAHRVVVGDLVAPFADGAFDLIVTNPPYVETDAPLSDDVRKEPALALFAGADGMDVYRRLAAETPRVLSERGELWLEAGDGQADRIAALFLERGWTAIARIKDGLGHERALGFQKSGISRAS